MGTYQDRFFGDWYKFFQNALDGYALQQKTIANNIANVDNPSYHPQEVSFVDQLKQMIADGNTDTDLQINLDFDPEFQTETGPSSFQPKIHTEANKRVDLNQEMANLAKTQILYDLAGKSFRPDWTNFVINSLMK